MPIKTKKAPASPQKRNIPEKLPQKTAYCDWFIMSKIILTAGKAPMESLI
jgi:hypothetical protein